VDTEPEVTEEVSAAPVSDAAPDTTEEPATFSREYVQELRREAASYRTKAQVYQDAFDGIADEDREVFLEMAKQYKSDPKSAVDYFDQVTKTLREQFAEEVAAAEDELNRPLTLAEYNRLQDEARQKAEEAAHVARIESEAKSLGYDPASAEYTYLLKVAADLPGGSIKEAHEKIEAAFEARIQKRLAEMQAEAEESPTAPSTGAGAAPSGERPLRDWKDAEAAARARLEAAKLR